MKPQSLGNSEDFYHKIVWKAKSLKFLHCRIQNINLLRCEAIFIRNF